MVEKKNKLKIPEKDQNESEEEPEKNQWSNSMMSLWLKRKMKEKTTTKKWIGCSALNA